MIEFLTALTAGTPPPMTPPIKAARPACSSLSRKGVFSSVAASVTKELMNWSRPSSAPSSSEFLRISLPSPNDACFFIVSETCFAMTLLNTSSGISSTLERRAMIFLTCLREAPLSRAFSIPPRPKPEKPAVIAAVIVPLVNAAPRARSCFSSGVRSLLFSRVV